MAAKQENSSSESIVTSRINEYITAGNNIRLSEDEIEKLSESQFSFPVRVEPKTRRDDLTESLRYCVYDPLWMLSRQWQMGEFRANNAGTALSVKCTFNQDDCSTDPIEPTTEQVNPSIDLMAKVESAMYYIDLLVENEMYSADKLKELREKFKLDWNSSDDAIGYQDGSTYGEVQEKERALNTRKDLFKKSFQSKAFDGEQLYRSIKGNATGVDGKYKKWFKETYEPVSSNNEHWNSQSMSYTIDVNAGDKRFQGDRYQGGRVSWHSVDIKEKKSNSKISSEKTTISALPTLASYAGAPNKRLWQFEDRRVYLGNSEEQQSAANELFMKYATMYSNDWMLIPFNTKIGKHITVENITILDTFGQTKVICDTENKKDYSVDKFYANNKYGSSKEVEKGLFYAPQLVNTIEGNPVEQVDFLRDEMSNMIWGVETIASDGCGTTIDQKNRAVRLGEIVNNHNESLQPVQPSVVGFDADGETNIDRKHAAFQYKLQTKVPYNWIPFLPQRMKNSDREMALRRGKMPCFLINDKMDSEILPVKPVTSILREGLDSQEYKAFYINEEEVQQTGIKLIKNYQRARWINGKTYNWLGLYKRLANFSEKSGLEFDSLKKK